MSKQIAQIWTMYPNGGEGPSSNKFYSKIGTAVNLANKWNQQASVYRYFVKVYEIKEVNEIGKE